MSSAYSSFVYRLFAGFVAATSCLSALAQDVDSDEFSMQVMDVFTIQDKGTVITGIVSTGALEVGDVVCVPLKSGEIAPRTVDSLEMGRKLPDRVEKGQSVGVLLQIDKKLVEKGALMHSDCELEDAPEDGLE